MAIKKITSLFKKIQPVKVTPAASAQSVAIKKAVKKSPVKKAQTAKKTTPKTSTKTFLVKKPVAQKKTNLSVRSTRLVVASDSESFWVTDGQVLNSVAALERALTTMKKSVYDYHALVDGNHFADWVDTVLADTTLADTLRPIKNPKAAANAIKKHLNIFAD